MAGRLGGRRHRLSFDFSNLGWQRAGAGGGGGVTVTGAHNAGATQVVVGATGTISNWLLLGDLVEIDGELKEIREDVSLSAGAATLEIWPPLHKDMAGGESVDIDTPAGTWYLVSDSGFGASHWRTVTGESDWLHEAITLSLEEDISV